MKIVSESNFWQIFAIVSTSANIVAEFFGGRKINFLRIVSYFLFHTEFNRTDKKLRVFYAIISTPFEITVLIKKKSLKFCIKYSVKNEKKLFFKRTRVTIYDNADFNYVIKSTGALFAFIIASGCVIIDDLKICEFHFTKLRHENSFKKSLLF